MSTHKTTNHESVQVASSCLQWHEAQQHSSSSSKMYVQPSYPLARLQNWLCVGIMTPNAAEVNEERYTHLNSKRWGHISSQRKWMTSKVYTTIKFEWERTDIIDEEMTVSSRAKVYEEIDSRIYFDEAREIVIKAKVNDKYDITRRSNSRKRGWTSSQRSWTKRYTHYNQIWRGKDMYQWWWMWMTSKAVHDNQFEEERTDTIKEEMTGIIKEEGKWGERQPWARC